jgi:sulfate adenylyltransferase
MATNVTPGPIRQIPAHGGTLINRVLEGNAREAAIAEAKHLHKIRLSERETSDVEIIGIGAVSPLTGFMNF